jgi:hypothetical protein
MGDFKKWRIHRIRGIGRGFLSPSLPHHLAYGSVPRRLPKVSGRSRTSKSRYRSLINFENNVITNAPIASYVSRTAQTEHRA